MLLVTIVLIIFKINVNCVMADSVQSSIIISYLHETYNETIIILIVPTIFIFVIT